MFRPGHPASKRRARLASVALPLGVTFMVIALTAAPVAADPGPPSASEVKRSKEKIRERAAEVGRIKAKLAQAAARLEELNAKADDLVQRYYRETVKLHRATATYQAAHGRLTEARRGLQAARDGVGQLAAESYRTGGTLTEISTLLDADGPQELIDRVSTVQLLARQRTATFDRMRSAKIVASVLREQAEQALAEQRHSIQAVEDAEKAAQIQIARQRPVVERLSKLKATLQQKLADAQERASLLEEARQDYLERLRRQEAARERAARERTVDAAARAGRRIAESSGRTACAGKPTSPGAGGYPNGLIPPEALCVLPQPGQLLRADAAAAFARLNRAYRAAFGRPICVTDSYRTLAEQQRLDAQKPSLAAAPGTSNHGWGLAADLCGGIERFGSSQHQWMLSNAPRFGWFHPSWAPRR